MYDSRKFCHYSSHLPVLHLALSITDGDVLEMGMGIFSTPFIHWLCMPRYRHVLSVENDKKCYESMLSFENEFHRLLLIDDWDCPELDRKWDVVFLDHAPGIRRREDLLRFAKLARVIVVHDTNGRTDRHYKFQGLWPNFKYVLHYGQYFPQSTIVSNVLDVRALRIC